MTVGDSDTTGIGRCACPEGECYGVGRGPANCAAVAAHEAKKRGGLSAVDRLVGYRCADCGGPIVEDNGPPDGWQLEDGRTVCHACCVVDTKKICEAAIDLNRVMNVELYV